MVDANGTPVGRTLDYSETSAEVLLILAGRDVELDADPEGFTGVDDVCCFEETLPLPRGLESPTSPDSLDCSGTPHYHISRFPATFSRRGRRAQKTFRVQLDALVADLQTPRVLTAGTVYSFGNEFGECFQQAVADGEQRVLVPIRAIANIDGFVPSFRLQ